MITKIQTNQLLPTEEIIPSHLLEVEEALGLDTELWPPILVSEQNFILDGHHRHAIALEHDISDLLAIVIDYADENLQVVTYNEGVLLDKMTLLKIYETGVVLKAKTTRHLLKQ